MSFFPALLLSLSVTLVVGDVPDCYNCPYYNGIGYVKSQEFCSVFFVCYKTPDGTQYTFEALCCAYNMTFDEEHLTCVNCINEDPMPEDCNDSRELCLTSDHSTNLPCPYSESDDPTKYYVPINEEEYQLMSCPMGQVWSQDLCTCDFGDGPIEPPCNKILSFNFTDSYDSYSCNNFAAGEAYNEPELNGESLCLNGDEQYVAIPFLNNWFAWNPISKNFSLSVIFKAAEANQTAGIFSTNCDLSSGAAASVTLTDGQLEVILGYARQPLGEFPPVNDFVQLCVTFNDGTYKVYYNHVFKFSIEGNPHPSNSQQAATLGYDAYAGFFSGYIDSFCFYDIELPADQC